MTPHKQNPATPIMSDTSDNISDKSLPDPDRQTLRADIIDRYENTLRSLDDGWQPIESVPLDEEILAAIEVHNTLEKKWWEIHIICIDSETGEITRDCYNGWDAGDYSHWMPLPAPPQSKRAAALSDLAALDGETI